MIRMLEVKLTLHGEEVMEGTVRKPCLKSTQNTPLRQER